MLGTGREGKLHGLVLNKAKERGKKGIFTKQSYLLNPLIRLFLNWLKSTEGVLAEDTVNESNVSK